ncbi:hypothetical protein [Adhaeribacter pallidiroseus]|uniref:Uncharacterized protein n=1 Tax=Adhaeribacter pallidiroseus TaxID=2072847 RepID=A0A369QMP1_9BACT|nr:hypothetical protein [Adhaeribacter pallidiroseus]RDC65620.1 hypothetical protein AHMF7616_04250 [Adhaeribacter pallidiroseus]
MTAIIGVLNKSAVALAADSASTVSGGEVNKVYNNANKIFNLASNYPVGISIYNSAEFMGIPWETIIKMYKKELGTRNFPNLFEYANDFITYLNKIKLRVNTYDVELYLNTTIFNVVKSIHEVASTEFEDTFPDKSQIDVNQEFNNILVNIIQRNIQSINNTNTLIEFIDYTQEMFLAAYEVNIVTYINNLYSSVNLSLAETSLIAFKEFIYLNIVKDIFDNPYSGIIITGFGEDDVFPKLRSYIIGGIIDHRIRYKLSEDVIISTQNTGAITPFAQVDIISTFLKGIDPFIINNITAGFKTILDIYNVDIENAIPTNTDSNAIKAILNTTPALIDKFKKIVDEVCNERNLFPILRTIGTLSKEDLTEMAESLIDLTYLKRRVSFEEESVGGPVDVAVITKGDGFVWIKRKHYFKPEMNLNYLASVFNQRNT